METGGGGGEGVSEGLALEMTASLPPCGGLACKYSLLSSLIETAARTMEGGCIHRLVIQKVANLPCQLS